MKHMYPNCRRCGCVLTDTNRRSAGNGKTDAMCKLCHCERMKQWRIDNPEKLKEIDRRRWLKHKADPVKYTKTRIRLRDRLRKIRADVLAGYGGKCACCGESHPEFLALDHIDGGGNKERKAVGGSQKLYQIVKEAGFPKQYRLLCHNCNQSRGLYGFCPHEIEIKEPNFSPPCPSEYWQA